MASELHKTKTSLFSTDQHFTQEGLELDADVGLCIKGVWEKWLGRGYGIHEIGTVMTMKVWEMTMEYVLKYGKRE